jgi:DNA-binding NarL/FixJ family response regulator
MHRLRAMGPPCVAVLNTTPDTVDLLKDVLEQAGFIVATGYTHDIRDGKLNLDAFLKTHQPRVILYDVSPPYDRNWAFLQHLRATLLQGYRFVITATNRAHVEALVDRHDEKIYEVVGKAEDLDAIVRATREALRARDVIPPTSLPATGRS